jgi:hypothetical protein
MGDFNSWDRDSHPCEKNAFGVWSLKLPDKAGQTAIVDGSRIKVRVWWTLHSRPLPSATNFLAFSELQLESTSKIHTHTHTTLSYRSVSRRQQASASIAFPPGFDAPSRYPSVPPKRKRKLSLYMHVAAIDSSSLLSPPPFLPPPSSRITHTLRDTMLSPSPTNGSLHAHRSPRASRYTRWVTHCCTCANRMPAASHPHARTLRLHNPNQGTCRNLKLGRQGCLIPPLRRQCRSTHSRSSKPVSMPRFLFLLQTFVVMQDGFLTLIAVIIGIQRHPAHGGHGACVLRVLRLPSDQLFCHLEPVRLHGKRPGASSCHLSFFFPLSPSLSAVYQASCRFTPSAAADP